MLRLANDLAYEHVQVMTDRDDWYSGGDAFLRRPVPGAAHQCGERRQGDRHQPHALPTKRAGRYTAGWCVGKF